MRYRTARQAWHDAFYTGKENTVDQFLILGVNVQKTVLNNSTSACMDAWLKGRVQNVIQSLPENIRGFGNCMYSPMRTIDDLENAQEAVFNNFWYNFKGEKLSAKKWELTRELTIAAVLEYFYVVFGNPSPFKSRTQLAKFLKDEREVSINVHNWQQDWLSVYNALLNSCGYIDSQALKPVSQVITLTYDKIA